MPKSKVADPYDMRQKDIECLVTCLRNTIDPLLTIDAVRVAKEMEYENSRSVGNRMSMLKKKYGNEKAITVTGYGRSVVTSSNAPTIPSASTTPTILTTPSNSATSITPIAAPAPSPSSNHFQVTIADVATNPAPGTAQFPVPPQSLNLASARPQVMIRVPFTPPGYPKPQIPNRSVPTPLIISMGRPIERPFIEETEVEVKTEPDDDGDMDDIEIDVDQVMDEALRELLNHK